MYEWEQPGPKAPALLPTHGFSTAVSCITQVAAALCSKTAGVAKQPRMKGYANVIIPTLPRAGRCFSCRVTDPDSTRFVESHCGGLPDCNRHTWSDGDEARRPMVETMILERLMVPGLSRHDWKEAGASASAFLAGRPRAGSKGI